MWLVAPFVVSAAAFAADARVVGIWEPDAVGNWNPADMTGEAWVIRPDGSRAFLNNGTLVPRSDRVVTQEARVALQLSDNDTITIYPGSSVVQEEWGVLQELGAVLYEVEGAFRVRYARTEAVVEGTRFLVRGAGAEPEAVVVYRGRVRVRNPQGEVVVTAGQMASLTPGLGPALAVSPVAPLLPGAPTPKPERGLTPWVVGIGVGGGLGFQGAETGWRGQIRTDILMKRAIVGRLRAVGSVGWVNSEESSQFPINLGVEAAFGAFSVGGSGALLVGYGLDCDTGQAYPAIRGGGAAHVGAEVWSGSVGGQARVLGGWADGPTVNGTLGAAVRF